MQRTYAGRSSKPPVRRSLHAFFPTQLTVPLLSALLVLLSGPATGAAQIRPIELEGFIVTGTPVPRAEGSEGTHVTILKGQELRDRGMGRVVDALAEVPGLVVVQSGSYGSTTSVFFRGAEADHMKVMVDGVEMNQAGGAFDFAGLSLADVERIEILRGPSSALYGSDAMAGVIHVITNRSEGPPRATLTLDGGSYGRRDLSAVARGGTAETRYSVAFSQLTSDGILPFNNEMKTRTVSGSVHATPEPGTRVSVSGRYSDREYHFPTDGGGAVVDQNAASHGDEVSLGLQARRLFSSVLELGAVLNTYSWDGGSDDPADGPADTLGFFAFQSLDAFRRTSLNLSGNVALEGLPLLSFGVELENLKQRSFSHTDTEYGLTSSESNFNRSNLAPYAHLVSEGRAWSMNLGGRVEANEQYGTFFTYQAGASYALGTVGTRIRGSLGRGFKEPTFLETSTSGYAVGNPDLEPERSFSWEAGIQQKVGETGVSLDLTWFHQSLENLIQYTFMAPESGGPNYFNVAEARSQGLEAALRAPLGPVKVSGGYTYLATKVLDAGFDEGDGAVFVDGAALIRRPSHQFSLSSVLAGPRGLISGSVRFVGSRQDRDFGTWPASAVQLAAYTLVELVAELPIRVSDGAVQELTLTFGVANLLDESYEELFNFQAPGRAFRLGARMGFGG